MDQDTDRWIMYGLPDDDPECVHTFFELEDLVRRAGFLPLFRNSIEGFSVEEYANPQYWWTGIEERDPWEWRKEAARDPEIAYGKFFGGKAGLISREWLPVFMSLRRNGHDFESMWYAGKIRFREKKIMDALSGSYEMPGWELKKSAGFGTGGERNFSGSVTELQNLFFVVVSDFRRRKNKYGLDYGWDVSVYARPESVWGDALTDEMYRITPRDAYYRIREQMEELYPDLTDKTFTDLIGRKPEKSEI